MFDIRVVLPSFCVPFSLVIRLFIEFLCVAMDDFSVGPAVLLHKEMVLTLSVASS